MQRSVLILILGLMVGLGAQPAHTEQSSDPRIADFVKSGKLRAAFGMNPTIAAKDPASGQLRGPALTLAQALAKRMNVELVPVEYPSPGTVLQGLDGTAWDVTFLAIDPGRAGVVDFSTPYAQSDFTYLVPADSPLRASGDADRAGIKIATVRNDASDLLLTRLTKNAEIVRADNINSAVDLLRGGQATAVGAPRAVLIVQSAKLAGSRVLDDGFAPVRYAAVVPKGQAEFLAYINEFIEEAKKSGLVKQAYEAAGIRGIQVAGQAGQ